MKYFLYECLLYTYNIKHEVAILHVDSLFDFKAAKIANILIILGIFSSLRATHMINKNL